LLEALTDGQAGMLLAVKEKESSRRKCQQELFIERPSYCHDGLGKKGHTNNFIKVIERIGLLREKYPRASKL
jgi:hypothetical protein